MTDDFSLLPDDAGNAEAPALPDASQDVNQDAAPDAGAKAAHRGKSRIAQALRKIKVQAARSLASEAAPIRLPGKSLPEALPLAPLERGLSPEERAGLAEVADHSGGLLLCMPPAEAVKQGLRLRLAGAVPRTRNKTLVLRRRPEGPGQGLWDMYTDCVRPGEARFDAAARVLEAGSGLRGLTLTQVAEAENEAALSGSLAVFVADLPPGLYPDLAPEDMLEVDEDELRGLLCRSRELLSPELVWAAAGDWLFS